MKLLSAALTCFFLLIAFAALSADDTAPWFDFERCAYCKAMAAEEGLFDHMHSEYHDLKNGLLWVLTVDDDYKDALVRAQAAATKVGEEMQKAGQVPPMCGHCGTWSALLASGAAMECVETGVGNICVMTSDDPEMIKRIQDFGHRNNEELKKYFETRPAE